MEITIRKADAADLDAAAGKGKPSGAGGRGCPGEPGPGRESRKGVLFRAAGLAFPAGKM